MRRKHQLNLFLAVESETTAVPETTPIGATNQSSAEQATGNIAGTGPLPSSATSEQNLRFESK